MEGFFQRNLNNPTVRNVTEEEKYTKGLTSMPVKSTHHIKNHDKNRKNNFTRRKQNQIQRNVDQIHHIHPLTDNKNANRRETITINHNTKKNKSIYRRDKNKLKFRGNLLVNTEHENKKEKKEISNTVRTKLTPILGLNWMKIQPNNLRKTSGRNLQVSRREIFNKFPDIV